MSLAQIPSSRPGLLAQAFAPIGRLSRNVQNGIMKALGLQDTGNASKVFMFSGLVTVAVAGILSPPLALPIGALGTGVFAVGAGGAIENHLTNRVANLDGKGNSTSH